MHIELHEDVASAARDVLPVLLLRALTLQRDPLGAHTLVSKGRTVKIAVSCADPSPGPVGGIGIRVHAARASKQLLFEGSLLVEPRSVRGSCLILRGDYAPAGDVGTSEDFRTLIVNLREELAAKSDRPRTSR